LAHTNQMPGIHPKEIIQHYTIPVYTTIFLKMKPRVGKNL
jgi:hypothetical protein